MLKRHSNELMARLERVHDIGCAEIRKSELLRWYERERLTKSIWVDVLEKWEEIDDSSTIFVADSEGCWVIIYGKGITASEEAWFTDISSLAGIDNT